MQLVNNFTIFYITLFFLCFYKIEPLETTNTSSQWRPNVENETRNFLLAHKSTLFLYKADLIVIQDLNYFLKFYEAQQPIILIWSLVHPIFREEQTFALVF